MLPPLAFFTAVAIVAALLAFARHRRVVRRLEEDAAKLRRAADIQLATIEALALAIEARDGTSPTQVRKMQAYAAGLARAAGMPEEEIPGLKTATLLHDIGNLAIPEHIFSKPGPLTLDEFHKVQTHPRISAEILKDVPFAHPVASMIFAHHEHWDGKGYPQGLKGTDIPLGARIIAIVDSYTAVSSHRPHRPASSYEDAIRTLRGTSGTILDPALVETFIEILPSVDVQVALEERTRGNTGPDSMVAHRPGATALEDIAGAHLEARALYQIAQVLGASLGLNPSMGLIAENLKDVVPFSCAALFLVSEESGRLECRWATGRCQEAVRQVSVELVEEIEGLLAALNERAAPAMRSSLAAQLICDNVGVGALAVFHEAAHAYSPDHRRVLQRVADHAALVIRNSLLFERTQEDSFTDPLTRLPNRRYMLLYLDQQMARAEQSRTTFAVVMMDLDGFKEINDTLGHQAGDRALYEVAKVLRATVRSYDLCIRYGGDEFVVVLWGCDGEQAAHRSREMQQAVASMFFEARPNESRRLSVSSGVAVFPDDGHTHEELLDVADMRMYHHKAREKLRLASVHG